MTLSQINYEVIKICCSIGIGGSCTVAHVSNLDHPNTRNIYDEILDIGVHFELGVLD